MFTVPSQKPTTKKTCFQPKLRFLFTDSDIIPVRGFSICSNSFILI